MVRSTLIGIHYSGQCFGNDVPRLRLCNAPSTEDFFQICRNGKSRRLTYPRPWDKTLNLEFRLVAGHDFKPRTGVGSTEGWGKPLARPYATPLDAIMKIPQ